MYGKIFTRFLEENWMTTKKNSITEIGSPKECYQLLLSSLVLSIDCCSEVLIVREWTCVVTFYIANNVNGRNWTFKLCFYGEVILQGEQAVVRRKDVDPSKSPMADQINGGTGNYNFKVVLLGEGCVGKTSMVLRYVEDKFNDQHIQTLQVVKNSTRIV